MHSVQKLKYLHCLLVWYRNVLVHFVVIRICLILTEVCPPGTGVYTQTEALVVCVQCVIGFYKGNYANTECLPCPSGFITEATGATSQNNCTVRE